MKEESTLTSRIIEAVGKAQGCQMEEMLYLFPDLTWNQVFLEVDRLSRSGQLRLTLDGRGIFTLRVPEPVPVDGFSLCTQSLHQVQ